MGLGKRGSTPWITSTVGAAAGRYKDLSRSILRSHFFECLACGRQYALRPGQELTYRWRHPISLALYGVIFDPPTNAAVLRAAESLREGRSDDEIAALVKEIRLELNDPTQQVRDILDCRATEEELRNFLGLVCLSIESALKSGRH
jgi:hypothetical protein